MSELDQKVVDNVATYGFHSQGVFGEGDEPEFRYSVGFWETLRAPEIIIFGLKADLSHSMLWEMFRQIKAGAVLKDGARWSDLIAGFDCVSRPVHASQVSAYFGHGIWYKRLRTGGGDLSAYQIFWPGKVGGQFPWESDCHIDVRRSQPLLYLPNATGLA